MWWIKQPGKRFKPFIANRVGSFRELTSINKWRYIPTKENPADVLLRGETARGCLQNKLWWNGPKFLQDNEDKWPKMPQFTDKENKSEIKGRSFLSVRDKRSYKAFKRCVDCFKSITYSNLCRLKRVRTWVKRFIYNCQMTPENR